MGVDASIMLEVLCIFIVAVKETMKCGLFSCQEGLS